ncbi:M24 family metallopeptidase [Natronobeatus ordinarius]|uniref:M24 family metallopeptidase n=1 Tax=Natronobeatus ordinarius TaxID=2963433 RepID=UPI0020CDFB85|nr:M24 family metallopeptidase [Natronobeatus ordinarius]
MTATPFDRREYEDRIDRTKTRMREAGLDALFVTDPANMNYLTGYDGWSFYVHQGVIVSLEHDQPVWVGREMDANGAKATVWIDHEHIRSYSDDHVHSPVGKHPMDYVATVLEELGLENAALGVEMDAAYYTARTHERLQRELPEATLVDADLLVNEVRIVKSDREIEYIEEAVRLSEAAMEAGIDAIGDGVPESEVAAEIYQTLVGGTDELPFGGDYPAIVPLMPSGEHTGTPHLTWTDEPFSAGDPVIIELSGCRHRYHSPLARTAVVGEIPDEMAHVADVVVEGLNAALETAEPGVTCEAVELAWRETIAEHGIEKESRIGYSMGCGYPPDWGEHTASLRPGDETVLEENMTFHLIPGIWLDEFGVEISESFRVTSTGAERFSSFPQKLFSV